ncbi:helix-turn-helix domain-containing protein [Bifidobacterium sp. ESL0784]|uniref:helix-turn-helix domain-containing protein n=1 Tax=Bifidobacterium sp. ESL0784 TaxID=2983231 RepID=UPI0023F7A2FC|nr:helix-turn-helix domain-containing protein [Bifidobacterium sp. ESL0784]MDF7641737.1 helix-turn-helix domain-containing protein [Bifidobacterium sp. ESL0784]
MARRKHPNVTQAEQDKIRELHAQGKSLNSIAKTLHRSTSTIKKYADLMGLSFERGATVNATMAKTADAAAKRAILKDRLLDEATSLLEDLHKPYPVYMFTQSGSYLEHEMKKPPADVVRNLMTSVGIALQRSIDLERVDQQSEASTTVIDDYLKSIGIS